jgi:hypothetical protein
VAGALLFAGGDGSGNDYYLDVGSSASPVYLRDHEGQRCTKSSGRRSTRGSTERMKEQAEWEATSVSVRSARPTRSGGSSGSERLRAVYRFVALAYGLRIAFESPESGLTGGHESPIHRLRCSPR